MKPDADGKHPASLYRDRSFWSLTVTQFLGAFNDNLFKQMLLLMAIPVGDPAAGKVDRQGLATVLFSLPFVLFSGLAGFLADRHSKRRVIVLSKVAEIVVMALGMAGFYYLATTGYSGLLIVLFLMGVQSTFFGPGKYGILPEMVVERDLPRANGVILMTTFLAIIFGTAAAGFLKQEIPDDQLWKGGLVCVAIAVAGTLASLPIRSTGVAEPGLRFRWSALAVPGDTLRLLLRDRPLLMALGASSVFWMVGGIAIQAVNSLGLVQLDVKELKTSIMTATIGLGIAIGAVAAGKLSRGKPNAKLVRGGLWGIVACLALLAIAPGGNHLLGYKGSLATLAALGVAAAFFAIPVQVFLQSRPPENQKGRMIGVMNLANFSTILLAGVIYAVCDWIVGEQGWPRSAIFAIMAAMVLPVALLYKFRTNEPT